MPSERAIGLFETRGVVGLTAGIEAMMKTADVECVAVERVSSGYFAAAIQGSIAAVRQAMDAGAEAVRRYGDLRSAQIYPKPHEVASALLANGTAEQLSGRAHRARQEVPRERLMLLAEVLGRVWAERQVPDLDGRRMVLVRDLSTSAAHVAVDLIDVAAGNTVLVVTDDAAQTATGGAAVDAAVVALVAGADRLPTPPTSPKRRRAERTSP